MMCQAPARAPVQVWRCAHCNKHLGEYRVQGAAWLSRDCPRCGRRNTLALNVLLFAQTSKDDVRP